jgi:hypothetical protein
VFTRDGADALGKLLKEMASKLDIAISSQVDDKRAPHA